MEKTDKLDKNIDEKISRLEKERQYFIEERDMILADPTIMSPMEKYFYEKDCKQELDSFELRIEILRKQISKE